MGNEEGEAYLRIALRMPPDDYTALETLAARKGVPLAAFCRSALQEYILKESMSEEIERRLVDILESDKFDDLFAEKVGRAMSARKRS
jgi:hypothetical protein